MTALKQYIDRLSTPVFVTDRSFSKILHANPTAGFELETERIAEIELDKHLKFLHLQSDIVYAQLNFRWYQAAIHDIELDDQTVKLIELRQIAGIPDSETLESWKNMIAVMLHRLRSPLTGISGYVDMIEDENKDEQLNKRFLAIHKGFNHIYDLMDELEILHNIPAAFDDAEFSDIELKPFIQKLLMKYEPVSRERILVDSVQNTIFYTNPEALHNILSVFLNNAIMHSEGPIKLVVSPEDNGQITVQNQGNLPDEIRDRVYHPFITTRATNLGIGLTKAVIYAQQTGGIIFHNNDNSSVSFYLQASYCKLTASLSEFGTKHAY